MGYVKFRLVAKSLNAQNMILSKRTLQEAREEFDALGRAGLLYKEVQALHNDSLQAGFEDAWETLESYRFVREAEE